MPSRKRKDSKKKRGKKARKAQQLACENSALPQTAASTPTSDSPISGELLLHDAHLLDRARTQWQFGDWESLTTIETQTLEHHPARAKLALMVAAAHSQCNDPEAAYRFARQAHDWGCSRTLISQIFISGVYNSLGRAAAASGQQARALGHLQTAVAVGSPGNDQRLLARARMQEQLEQIGCAIPDNLNALASPRSSERLGHRQQAVIQEADQYRRPGVLAQESGAS